jgi:hypothetical protein
MSDPDTAACTEPHLCEEPESEVTAKNFTLGSLLREHYD